MTQLQAIRGMNDILPHTIHWWHFLENHLRQLTQQYGYEEIRFPVVEKTALFKRTIGEATDVVEKEMYTFEDRNGESLSLRPEGTAACVRAVMQHGLLHQLPQKLWYLGPMYRHERPQKGRYRQFYHFGLEAFGLTGPLIEAELLAFTYRLWQRLGIDTKVRLEINSLGSFADRQAYKKALVAYFTPYHHQLDEDSQRRLITNPLRILDSKNPALKSLIEQAPSIVDYLEASAAKDFQDLLTYLTELEIPYQVAPRLVRGLDYYNNTVFEWVTDDLGAQGTICAGGRYDPLVSLLGGQSTPAVGFAMGLERIILLLETLASSTPPVPHLYLMTLGENAISKGLVLVEQLRSALPQLRIQHHLSGGSIKSQFKKADKSGAMLGLVLGEDELARGEIVVKYLREEKAQTSMSLTDLINYLKTYSGDK